MRRIEIVCLVAVAVALVIAGLTWMVGPYALVSAGAALGVLAFALEIKDPT